MRRKMVIGIPTVLDFKWSIAFAEGRIFGDVHSTVGAKAECGDVPGSSGRSTTIHKLQGERLESFLVKERLDEASSIGNHAIVEHGIPEECGRSFSGSAMNVLYIVDVGRL